jgi:hypothetical protein
MRHPDGTLVKHKARLCAHVISRQEMYCTNVLMYRTMVLLARLTKVRR